MNAKSFLIGTGGDHDINTPLIYLVQSENTSMEYGTSVTTRNHPEASGNHCSSGAYYSNFQLPQGSYRYGTCIQYDHGKLGMLLQKTIQSSGDA